MQTEWRQAVERVGGGRGSAAQCFLGQVRAAPQLAGGMALALALRVFAGLLAAALAALLLEHYGLAGPPSSLPQPRNPQRPHPAPGPGDSNIFWGLQVTRREAGGRWVLSGNRAVPLWERDLRLFGTKLWLRRSVKLSLEDLSSAGLCPVLPGVGSIFDALHLCLFLTPQRAIGPPLPVLPLPDSDICLCSIPAFGRYPTFT